MYVGTERTVIFLSYLQEEGGEKKISLNDSTDLYIDRSIVLRDSMYVVNALFNGSSEKTTIHVCYGMS